MGCTTHHSYKHTAHQNSTSRGQALENLRLKATLHFSHGQHNESHHSRTQIRNRTVPLPSAIGSNGGPHSSLSAYRTRVAVLLQPRMQRDSEGQASENLTERRTLTARSDHRLRLHTLTRQNPSTSFMLSISWRGPHALRAKGRTLDRNGLAGSRTVVPM